MTCTRDSIICRRSALLLAMLLGSAFDGDTAQAGFSTSASFVDNWTAVRTVVQFPEVSERTLTNVLAPVNTATSTSISREGASDGFIQFGDGQRVGGRAESSGFATASQGMLHAYARAFAGIGPFQQTGGPPLFTAYASARFEASFDDNIIVGENLPVGTPVLFDLTWGYSSVLTPSPSSLVNIVNPAVTGVFFRLTGPDGLYMEGGRTSNDFSAGNSSAIVRVAAHAGDELVISMFLGASALIKAEFEGSFTAIADASHTAFMLLDPVTPGLNIESYSGHDYSTPSASSPVPEPTTLALLAMGLCVVFARRRFKSAQRRAAG